MLLYVLKRILLFIPTLIAISLLTFFISINAPGDPVELILNPPENNDQKQKSVSTKEYTELRHKLGLDLPLFYFSLTDATVSDTLYKIHENEHRNTLKRLSNKYGNWENVSDYYKSIQQLEKNLFLIGNNVENSTRKIDTEFLINDLYKEHEQEKINNIILTLSANTPKLIKKDLVQVTKVFKKLIAEKNSLKKYIPLIHWYGLNNQYHQWVIKFLFGDFGTSYQDKRPVKHVLSGALEKTVGISLLSILLAYLIAIPIGIYSAVKRGTPKEKTITTALFALYSLPNFWIATMLVIFLCGGDYLSLFPAPGASAIPENASFGYKFSENMYRLILPLFCWTYGSLAFISRQMRGGILSSLSQDYIQTARAKGLNEKQVVFKHALKNSFLPVITLFASVFPMAIAGSFVIETIFNIPGMGKLGLDALYARDYPVIFAVMMFTAILTMIGNLIADILYAIANPRIAYK